MSTVLGMALDSLSQWAPWGGGSQPMPSVLETQPIMDQEFGVTTESLFQRYELLQYTPDKLVTNKQFDIFEQMVLDDQIKICLDALKIIRLSSGYELIPASESNGDQLVADCVADSLERMDENIYDVIWNLMGALDIGWTLNELVWKFEEVGPWKGMVVPRKVASKNPKWFNTAVNDFNDPYAIVSISAPSYGRKYPIDKFIVYSFQKRYQNVFGTSRLRALYQWWWVKQVMIREMGIHMEKYGSPIPIGYYPQGMGPNEQSALLKALQQLKIQSAITAPMSSKIEFHSADGKGAQSFLEIIEKIDRQIAKVILGQTLTLEPGHMGGAGGSSSGGSSSRGTGSMMAGIQSRILEFYVDYLGRDLTEKPLATLIKRMVDYNFQGVLKYPQLKFKPLETSDLAPTVTTFLQAVQTGVIVPGQDDEGHIRDVLGFPQPTGLRKLRPARFVNSITTIRPMPAPVVDPKNLPQAGYRGPSPSGPGAPTNFAETKLFTGVKRRSFTEYEKKVDFGEALTTIEKDGVKTMAPKIGKVLRKAVDRLLNEIQRSKLLESKDTALVKKLMLGYKGEINSVFKDGLVGMARDGMKAARRELKGVRKMADISIMSPDEVLDFIQSKAFDATDRVTLSALNIIRNELYNGIKMEKSFADVVSSIEDALDPFFVEGALDDDAFSGPRLTTIVRTLSNEAWNEGKKSIYTDPDLDGFVAAYQYSAILDDRVRPNHAEMDGRIFTAEDPIWKEWTPPNGYNCRCTIVPVTTAEQYEVSDVPNVHPDEGFK